MQAVEWSVGKNWCPGCDKPVPKEHFAENSPVCRDCDKTTIVATTRKMVEGELLRTAKRHNSSDATSSFVDAVGGAKAYGELWADEFKRTLADPLATQKEKRAWFGLGIRAMQAQDKLDHDTSPDLSQYGDEELMAAMRPVAMQLLMEDPEFLRSCLARLEAKSPAE